MRTLELLNALNDREIRELSALVKAKKRKSLQTLLAELQKYKKRDSVPANEELFFKVFNKDYSSDKNYLLRNELRLLNDIIYDYLIASFFNNYLKKHRSTYHVWLVKAFFDRKIKGAFNTDIDRFIEYAQEHVKAEDSALLHDLKSLWMIYTYERNESNIQSMRNAVEEWKNEQIRHLTYRLRETEARNAFLTDVLNSVTGNVAGDDTRTEPQQIVDLNHQIEPDLFENYLILKKYAFQTKGLKRIDIVKQMLAFEESKDYNSEYQSLDSQMASLNSMAMEYIMLGDFEKADNHMLEAMRRAQENGRQLVTALLQNYIANQMNLGTYKKGIHFYNEHKTEIKNSRQFTVITIYKAYCHLFLGQADEALSAIPEGNSFTPHQSLMVRMVYLIAFIIRKQHDTAINDCYNIGRMAKANEGAYYDTYNWINGLFAKYLDALVMERGQRKTAMHKIKEELSMEAEKVKPLITTEFALRWLVQELKKN